MIFNPVVARGKKSPLPPPGKALEEYTWDEIALISEAGVGADYFKVGDTKSVLIQGTVGTKAYNDTYYVYIIDFDHDGDGLITFGGFKTAASGGKDICLTDGNYSYGYTNGTMNFNMNHWGAYNYGGWAACDLRYDVLGSTDKQPSVYQKAKTSGAVGYDASPLTAISPVPNTLMAALPLDLRKVMKPMTVYTDNTGGTNVSGNVTASVDYLPLLAEYEIFGARTNANTYEKNGQKIYPYFTSAQTRTKYRDGATGTAAYWWERSPRYTASAAFCSVNTVGNVGYTAANYSYGLAPIFKVGAPPYKEKALEDYTWEEISAISKAGIASMVFNIGDTKSITLFNITYYVQIIGFDHDDVTDAAGYGRDKAGITFQFGVAGDNTKNSLPVGVQRMYQDTYNYDYIGWTDSYIRTHWLADYMEENLPSELVGVIVAVNKLTSKGGLNEDIIKTSDKRWLLSEVEIFNESKGSYPGEGTQYEFYAKGGSTERYNGATSTNWWTRSPSNARNANFVTVSRNGTVSYSAVTSTSNYIAFAFCV